MSPPHFQDMPKGLSEQQNGKSGQDSTPEPVLHLTPPETDWGAVSALGLQGTRPEAGAAVGWTGVEEH